MIQLIDTHTHLTAKDFDSDRAAMIQRAVDAGVSRMITIGAGYGKEAAPAAVALAEQYAFIWASVGVHPQDAQLTFEIEWLQKLAEHPKVVAIGETGFDYVRGSASREQQELWFRAQVRLARQVKKPIIIHSREAGADCLKLLTEEQAHEVGGVFHCYAEDGAFAKELKKINFLVSFPGTVTFKNAENVRTVLKDIPLDQIMVETDAPFMAPTPHRGKRCESGMVVETAKKVAEVKGVEFEELARITSTNAERLFGLK